MKKLIVLLLLFINLPYASPNCIGLDNCFEILTELVEILKNHETSEESAYFFEKAGISVEFSEEYYGAWANAPKRHIGISSGLVNGDRTILAGILLHEIRHIRQSAVRFLLISDYEIELDAYKFQYAFYDEVGIPGLVLDEGFVWEVHGEGGSGLSRVFKELGSSFGQFGQFLPQP